MIRRGSRPACLLFSASSFCRFSCPLSRCETHRRRSAIEKKGEIGGFDNVFFKELTGHTFDSSFCREVLSSHSLYLMNAIFNHVLSGTHFPMKSNLTARTRSKSIWQLRGFQGFVTLWTKFRRSELVDDMYLRPRMTFNAQIQVVQRRGDTSKRKKNHMMEKL